MALTVLEVGLHSGPRGSNLGKAAMQRVFRAVHGSFREAFRPGVDAGFVLGDQLVVPSPFTGFFANRYPGFSQCVR
jgi:hypothetical protein